jgi:CRP-like cAMP-binding protein
MAKIKPLRQSPIFNALTDREIAIFARIVSEEEYSPGTLLTASNMKSDKFYFVERGKVSVSMGGSEGGDDLILGAGETFGEWALLVPGQLTAVWLKVSEPSNILSVASDDFDRFAKEEPETAFKILRALCARVRESVQDVKQLLTE